MKPIQLTLLVACTAVLAATSAAQNAQVSSVAVQPGNPDRVWVCNRDNGTVSVVNVANGSIVAEIPVGVHPRSLAFSADGSRVFVANQRGNVQLDVNFVTPFNGTEMRGSLSVINTATLTVATTLVNVGVEPYGVTVAPNGKYFAVSGFRSGTVKLYDAVTLSQVASLQYLRNLNQIPPPFTMADADSNRDGIADLGDPRGFVIRADSQRIYVTHNKSPFVSVLGVTLNGSGVPTALNLLTKINTDDYPFDPIFNAVRVQVIKSQGKPRFLEDIALSPDGTRALVPHVLHNVNHDVGHNFGPAFPGNFANRVYPALTMLDAAQNTYGQPADLSRRVHHELADPAHPAEYVPFGRGKRNSAGNIITLGGQGSPLIGGQAIFIVDGMQPGDTGSLFLGNFETNAQLGQAGTLYVKPRFTIPMIGNKAVFQIPNNPNYNGVALLAQALVTSPGGEQTLSTAVRWVMGTQGFGTNKMGYRAGHPGRVTFNAAGTHAVMVNRGSEDVFLYKVTANNLELQCVFPPRHNFAARAALDTTTPMGDLPLGMAMIPDATTPNNDDARLFVINETTRTLSVLRIDFPTGTVHKLKDQIPTHQGADVFTTSERVGEELFEDASRPQTAGNFNNSCGSCHFEGGDDGNVWQRGAGPRSTMPVYGGTKGTGLILWKGVRLNLGETGPMFGGENGGTGVFTDAEQQGLVDYHEKIAIPLNPNLDPITSAYSPAAAWGKDLYFGTNTTGLNSAGRHAGCAVCHADLEVSGSFPGPRFYTVDFLNPLLTGGENLGSFDPDCFALRENVIAVNFRDVNTGANIDANGDNVPDPDRNNDGYNDLETYPIMNVDTDDDFRRDDANSYLCPCDPLTEPTCDPLNPFRLFTRAEAAFSIPTKLGVFSSGPYFHDQVVYSLRSLVDPDVQATSPIYGSPAFPAAPPYPTLFKVFNDAHDCRGHNQFVPNVSKVQQTLLSTPGTVNSDIEAILAYIESL